MPHCGTSTLYFMEIDNKIVDAFTFNGEYDLLEIRFNILGDYVDQFIIIEAPTTFSGKPKPLYYEQQKERFKQWHNKIRYFVIDENYDEGILALADGSPNVPKGGAEHWHREFCQKESIKKALIHLNDDDVVFVGDVDEIWQPELSCIFPQKPLKVKHKVYNYWLNNSSSEDFWGTIMCCYKDIKDSCLNHIRSREHKKISECGWHFTSMAPEMRRKLTDSYTKESYATDWVMDNLDENMKNNKDFLGRDFKYEIDESDWPEWLKSNRHLYLHMIK